MPMNTMSPSEPDPLALEAAETVVAENLYAGFDLGVHDGGNQQRRRTK